MKAMGVAAVGSFMKNVTTIGQLSTPFKSHVSLETEKKLMMEMGLKIEYLRPSFITVKVWPISRRFALP